jgi:hypothetical protein
VQRRGEEGEGRDVVAGILLMSFSNPPHWNFGEIHDICDMQGLCASSEVSDPLLITAG